MRVKSLVTKKRSRKNLISWEMFFIICHYNVCRQCKHCTYVFMYFVLCNLYFVFCTLYFVLCIFFYFSIFSSFCISCSAVEFVIGMARRNQVLFEPFIRSQKVCMVTITDEPTKLHQMLFFKKLFSFFLF